MKTTITTLPTLPEGYVWARAITHRPEPWGIVPATSKPKESQERGVPQPGDLVSVRIGRVIDIAVYIPEAPEVTRARALLIGAYKMTPGEALDIAIARLLKCCANQ